MLKNESRVKYYLEIWEEWQRNDQAEINQMMGYPSQCLVMVANGSNTFEEMADDAETRAAKIVDSIIDDESLMTFNEKLAIHHFHLAAVWSSKRVSLEECYQSGLESLEIGLNKKRFSVMLDKLSKKEDDWGWGRCAQKS